MSETSEIRAECPFCGAKWTDRMLELFDRSTSGACSCCSGPHHAPAMAQPKEQAKPEEIRCDACNRAIYRLPDFAG